MAATAPRALAAPDKFRGTASARAVSAAMAAGLQDAGWAARALPMSDGGEGMLECFGGANRHAVVSGPLGAPVHAGWRLDGDRAVLETASAAGLGLLGGRTDPLAASTRGVGELICAALDAGARRIVLGAGGSATTDGGRGALEALAERRFGVGSAQLVVAADVRLGFLDAAAVFGPQKGADAPTVALLAARLRELATQYVERFDLDVTSIPGSGAAGGLAGGLAAVGAVIRPGFDVVAEEVGLAAGITDCELVLTGEGRLDATTLLGKVPEGVTGLARRGNIAAGVVAGSIDAGTDLGVPAVDLVARFGREAAFTDPLGCIRRAAAELGAHPPGG